MAEMACLPCYKKAKSSVAIFFSQEGAGLLLVAVLLFSGVLFVKFGYSPSESSPPSMPSESSPPSIPFTCPAGKLTCPSTNTTSQKHSLPPSSTSCPQYFRWIHEDLRPWASSGISQDAVMRAQKEAAFRLIVSNGRAYIDRYHPVFHTRDIFTMWGILQLLQRYPGRVPDLDLMFNCEDMPVVSAAAYQAAGAPMPPPLFRYCKDETTVDILFPDWSFWGWAEINIKPWVTLEREFKEANERLKWSDREPYAYWKGNGDVAQTRRDLMKCNVTKEKDWNARLYRQDWPKEVKQGFKNSDLTSQCTHKYKIYVEGRAWSVSEKYILACDSPTLFIRTRYQDFFSRGLIPGRHYWPIRPKDRCRSIKFAVDWGNSHEDEAQAIGKAASNFMQEEVKMDYVYDYMLHLLTEYSKLLNYKPSVPPSAVEYCLESMACARTGTARQFMMESMVSTPSDKGPCAMPPPFDPGELQELLRLKANLTKRVENEEQKAWNKGKT